MFRRKILLGVMSALIFLFAAIPQAMAQDPNRLAQLKISVWPEYDTPTVLVLIDGTLADKTNLPRQVAVLVPAAAQVTVTTWENPDGTLAPEQPHQVTDLGDGYKRVTFTTKQPTFRVEYYHDLLRGTPDKTMDFAFKHAAPADQVTLEIQQPIKATNFSVNPATPNTRTDADGFKYFTYQFAKVTAGQIISTQVKYTKTDPNPSVAPQTLPATAPAPTAGGLSSNIFIIAGMVILGLGVVLGIFVWQQRVRQVEEAAPKMSPRQFKRQRQRARGTLSENKIFCTQCGHPLDADDNFCPKCGTKRRVIE